MKSLTEVHDNLPLSPLLQPNKIAKVAFDTKNYIFKLLHTGSTFQLTVQSEVYMFHVLKWEDHLALTVNYLYTE